MSNEFNVKNKPYVILNAAMSLDGKIATVTGDSEFSSEADWQRVHKLRSEVDAIMVGINTIIKDDPKLYIKYYTVRNFLRIIIDSHARTPDMAQLFQMDLEKYPILIVTTEKAKLLDINRLKKKGATIFQTSGNDKVDLIQLCEYLSTIGVKRLLLEGGGTLNYSMFQYGLIDEVIIAIAPVVVGGEDAVTLVEGRGVKSVKKGFFLQLNKIKKVGTNVVLFYRTITATR
ncbi:MAG: 2,5-diamino-6-(ribosylamino)-4(3H)-pyrimidinone 5'-phosphate reductase [Promethearchaeota archaeon]|nr:MAG: 2,5-diamino-6-(ribosylamino)-4(3H)-pyrimidinone 5'-phosphate reductase [Candidatus Lokiarchaeota archaeon]